jgi:phage protein D
MTMVESLTATVTGRQMQGMTPVYRPTLNGVDLDITVSKLQIVLGEFQHDVVVIECSSDTLTETASMVGSAISFWWGKAPRTELFTGYVEGISDDKGQRGAGRLTFSMACLGSTKELQTGTPRVWDKITIPQVVKNLSYRGLLGFHGHDHSLVWPLIAQTEESDWKLICDLAKRLGWSVFNRYGVIMLYDPLKLFQSNGSYITLVSSSYTSTSYEDYERALVDFTPSEASDASYRQIGRKIAFFNGQRVQTTTQQGDQYTVFKYLTNIVARNPDEAEVYANSTSYAAANWGQQAQARVLGNANIYPGMCVDVLTSDPRFFKGRYNGRWLVRQVQHEADRQTFQTLLTLCRPRGSFGMPLTAYVPFWNEVSGITTTPTKSKPAVLLAGTKWNSSWAERGAREML